MNSILIILSLAFLPNFIYTAVPFVLNPGCDLSECKNYSNPAIYYANYLVNDMKIHILYSTFDELTISIFQTTKDYTPEFNYEALFERNYSAVMPYTTTLPSNSFSLIFRRLIEFNDTDDNGFISPKDTIINSYYLCNITTTNVTLQNPQTTQPSFEIPLDMVNGSLVIDIMYPGEEMREPKFPKLKTTPKSYYINVALQANNYSLPNTRFAFELYLTFIGDGGAKMFSSRFIDDQYTPGIFNVWQMNTLDAQYDGASMLWKPVVYQSEERSIEQNTLMKIYDIKNNVARDPKIDSGIFLAVRPDAVISAFNISLGDANDGFFAKTNYTFIQLTAGLGFIEPDSTTSFVTIALVISLALPAIVGIVALAIIVKRRFSRDSLNTYDTIDN